MILCITWKTSKGSHNPQHSDTVFPKMGSFCRVAECRDNKYTVLVKQARALVTGTLSVVISRHWLC